MNRVELGSQIIKEVQSGTINGCGYENTIWRHRDRTEGGIAVLARGGLGDPHSVSLEPLAKAIIAESEGEIIVGTTGVVRPRGGLFTAIRGASHAREMRADSAYGGMLHMVAEFKPDVLVVPGQSQGGITVTDAAMRWLEEALDPDNAEVYKTHRMKQPCFLSPKKKIEPIPVEDMPFTIVMPTDTPGVFGPLETSGDIEEGLKALGEHCKSDMERISAQDKFEMLTSLIFGHTVSIFEPVYTKGEIGYLGEGVDISPDLENLREYGIETHYAFHNQDLVPGAGVPCEFSESFDGGHIRVIWDPEPVANYVIRMASKALAR